MQNLDIRLLVSDKGLHFNQIAAEMGISRVYLSRVMKDPLKPEMREKVLRAIQQLTEE